MRLQVREGARSEAVLVKFDVDDGIEGLLSACEAKFGYRPSTITLDGARVRDVVDLEEGDKICCEREATRDRSPDRGTEQPVQAHDGQLNVSIKDGSDETVISFKVKATTKVSKMMKAYMQQKGMTNENHFRFTHDGDRMNLASVGEKTVGDLGIEDGDQIDAWVETVGGAASTLSAAVADPCMDPEWAANAQCGLV